MKRIIVSVLMLLLMLAGSRGALFEEAFNYSTGNLGSPWSGSSGSSITVTADSLTAASLPDLSPSGNRVHIIGGTARTLYRNFTASPVSGGTVYCSFLLKCTTLPTGSQYLIGMLKSGSTGVTGSADPILLYVVNAAGGYQLKISHTGVSQVTAPTILTLNSTNLIVMKYTFGGGGLAQLFLNPSPATEPASADATSAATGTDATDLQVVSIKSQSNSTQGNWDLDTIRIGLTWTEVMGGGVVVGPATKLGFSTPPVNAQVNAAMSAVVVQVQSAGGAAVASNGVPVTLALTSGSGTLSGTLTQNTDATGKATFNNLSINSVGAGKQLTATASGIGTGLTAAVSGNFSITAEPVVSGLVITQAVMTGSGFKVAGSTDQPGVFTQILGSSDAGRTQTNWVIVSYQNAGAGGEVVFTNPVSPALSQVFYRLRTGDTVTKLEPPSIGTPPVSQIVSPGTTATFSVTAVGPQLQYLWFFNGSSIPGATSSSLVIPNAQAGNIGNYYVVVANPAGTISSAVVTLGVGNIAPTITTEPQNQTVSAGGTAIFSVTATGTSPLHYQWYGNTNSLIAGATNATVTVTGVSTNDSGKKYRVIVSNGFGSDTSLDATLTVTPVPTGLPETNILGWAAFANVTGGAGGTETTVNTYAALRAACRAAGPIIIKVDGILVPNEDYCYIEGYDKTIVGVGTNSGLAGRGFRASGTNIIIANLTLNSTNSNADGVTIDNSSHGTGRNVWVDHCTFYDCTDGSVDVTKGADYVTVSWCKFYYAPVAKGVVNHEFVNLIASSDSDNPNGLYHVTFHHNWYSEYCRERMPSVRFGRVHVFNNYYDCFDNNYCVRTRINSEVLVENNYFIGVQNPWERFITSGSAGLLKATGNITNNCTFVNGWVSGAVVIPGNDTLGSELNPPPYTYTLTPATDVPYYIQTYSGHGKYPYVP